MSTKHWLLLAAALWCLAWPLAWAHQRAEIADTRTSLGICREARDAFRSGYEDLGAMVERVEESQAALARVLEHGLGVEIGR